MNIVVKVSSQVGKWVNIKYTSSNARSRMKLDKLIDQYEKGHIEITNPEVLDIK